VKRAHVLNLRVPRDLKKALRVAAEKDERSMSALATRILREWLADSGFYEVPDPQRPRRPDRVR
jgi:plasmid stability protein